MKRIPFIPQVVKRYSSSHSKPFYITTPIFYPNAAPHLGHLYSMLLCDVRNRWEKLKGKESFFVTGTDEHGLKIQAAAEKKGLPPKEFVDQLAVVFKNLAKVGEIDYDRFIRTTDDDHLIAVNHLWGVLHDKGYIYSGEHSGWYSVSDETFYPESQIEKKEDGKYYSLETGTEVMYEVEKNYFFKLSAFQDQLIKYIEDHPKFIIPQQRYTTVLNELKAGPLTDLSISRPSSRLKWGIPVPNDESQKIYVWVDALTNYLTAAGYPKLTNRWPATHLIGKDITRFHCIHWPSLLLAAEIELPNQIVVHGHWLSEGFKMSKSRGNVVDPVASAKYYGTDVLRFFLCENSVLTTDNNFSEAKLLSTREQLIDKFSNLILRSCGPKFNIVRAIASYDEGNLHTVDKDLVEGHRKIVASIDQLYNKMDPKMIEFNTSSAIQQIWNLVIQVNQFFQRFEPWKRPQNEQDLIIYTATEAVRVSAILSQPFIPELSKKFLDRISCRQATIEFAKFGSDRNYGINANRSGDHPIQKLKK